MRWNRYRGESGFHYGWTSERFWLSLSSHRATYYLDVGTMRIRWAGPDHRPLFSERYGYQKWHHLGRISIRFNRKRRGTK